MLLKPNFGALGVILTKKVFQEIVQKKLTPPDGNKSLSPRQEAPGQAATIKDCSNKKQLFGHMLKQLFVILVRKCGLGSESVQKIWIELQIGAKF